MTGTSVKSYASERAGLQLTAIVIFSVFYLTDVRSGKRPWPGSTFSNVMVVISKTCVETKPNLPSRLCWSGFAPK